MKKQVRLDAIINIINEYEVDTQEELTSLLNSKGFSVSQATISRDINELKLIKGAGVSKKYKYVLANVVTKETSPKIISLFKQVTLSINYANNLVIVKTLSGNANAAGMAIDQMGFEQILGTVAGDDTLLIVAKTNADAETVVKSLRIL